MTRHRLQSRQPHETFIQGQALAVAKAQVLRTSHTMPLEDQAISEDLLQEMIRETTEELIKGKNTRPCQ